MFKRDRDTEDRSCYPCRHHRLNAWFSPGTCVVAPGMARKSEPKFLRLQKSHSVVDKVHVRQLHVFQIISAELSCHEVHAAGSRRRRATVPHYLTYFHKSGGNGGASGSPRRMLPP